MGLLINLERMKLRGWPLTFQMQGWSSPLTFLTVELSIWMLIIHLLDTAGKVLSLEGAEAGHAFES